MAIPSLHEAASAEYARRAEGWRRAMAEEWVPERRAVLEVKATADLALWDEIVDFASPQQWAPEDFNACAASATATLDKRRAQLTDDEPLEAVLAFRGLRSLTFALEAAAREHRRAQANAQSIRNAQGGSNP